MRGVTGGGCWGRGRNAASRCASASGRKWAAAVRTCSSSFCAPHARHVCARTPAGTQVHTRTPPPCTGVWGRGRQRRGGKGRLRKTIEHSLDPPLPSWFSFLVCVVCSLLRSVFVFFAVFIVFCFSWLSSLVSPQKIRMDSWVRVPLCLLSLVAVVHCCPCFCFALCGGDRLAERMRNGARGDSSTAGQGKEACAATTAQARRHRKV